MDSNDIASIIALVIAALLLVLATNRVERTKGRVWYYHVAYAGFVTLSLAFIPEDIQFQIFSPVGVAVVGMVLPIYESIRAVCTPGVEDDKAWLQYWIAMELVSYSTEWIDDLAKSSVDLREHWYEFEFFYFLWLLLPYTDGSTLTFDYVTQPLLGPVIEPIAQKLEGLITKIVLLFINASHLWLLWAVFILMPVFLKRFMAVTLGTVYPVAASIVAVTTPQGDDDTYWLTYWSCFGTTFLIMDWIEQWLGNVPGFYTIVIFFIVYLMLPLFGGADQVFRQILVPLANQHETLLLRDAHLLRKEMESKIDPARWQEMRKMMASSLLEEEDEASDENNGEGNGDDVEKQRTSLLNSVYGAVDED